MLSLTPASAPRSISGRRPVIGLAIAGGGPLGAIYELAVLKALDEALDGVRMHDLDVYVGASSGAILASSLANRMSATRMARIFMGTANAEDRKSTRLNSSHVAISYAVFCLKK